MSQEKSKSKELILSVDAGTQSIRAALVDIEGNILHIVKTPIQPYFSEHPGWAEQKPDYYWEVFCKTTNQLMQQQENLKKDIKGVTLTTQRATMINVDKDGNALSTDEIAANIAAKVNAHVETGPGGDIKAINSGSRVTQ